MATDAQIQANRANAKKSTGPRTREGKDVSKRNRTIHSLAGLGIVLPEHLVNEIYDQISCLDSTLKPDNPLEESHRDAIAHHNVLAGEARKLQVDRILTIALESELRWDEERRAEAAVLADGLAKKPGSVALKLQQSKQGCDHLIELWKQLENQLDGAEDWDPDQRALALDMLGVNPALRKGKTALVPSEGVPLALHLKMVAVNEIGRLEQLKEDSLNDLDANAKRKALLGAVPDDPQLRKYQRYEREHLNIMLKLRKEFGATPRPFVEPNRMNMPVRDDKDRDSEEWHEAMDSCRAESETRKAKARAGTRGADLFDPYPVPGARQYDSVEAYQNEVDAWRARHGEPPWFAPRRDGSQPALDHEIDPLTVRNKFFDALAALAASVEPDSETPETAETDPTAPESTWTEDCYDPQQE